jgi:hypothetical protein
MKSRANDLPKKITANNTTLWEYHVNADKNDEAERHRPTLDTNSAADRNASTSAIKQPATQDVKPTPVIAINITRHSKL